MAKIKILKELPKSKKKYKKNTNFKAISKTENKFKEQYLNYYDDIKIPTKRYDW